ncbi:MAG: nitroreductase family protein [Pseudomonadaceae bacterium]|nr:nitroreductase family protein [Pseudomonadaceae bacterium]
MTSLSEQPVVADQVGLLEGLASTRAIRRYRDEPIPEDVLRDMLFTATRAPSGSNRQPFRFVVLTDSDKAVQAKKLIGDSAIKFWDAKRANDQYDKGSGADPNSPKSRMARTMQTYVDNLYKAPCLILPCLVRYREPNPMEGASIYPAVQNLLLAARAMGYGGVITGFHGPVQDQLKPLLGIPEDVFISCTVTLGKPQGKHGPVRRRPMQELVFGDTWAEAPAWAVDPPGTQHTSAGPPKGVKAL